MTHLPSQGSDLFPSHDQSRIARLCPRCRRSIEVEPHVHLCKHCGETLVDRGYCPICEAYLNQPVGASCAKHDVILEEHPEEFDLSSFTSRKWVTLETYPSRGAAEGLRIRLEAEGIPTFLDGERMGSSAMYQVATGGVKLQVPEELLDDARILISQSWSPPIHDPDDLDDAWDELAPEPGLPLRVALEHISMALGVVVLLVIVLALGLSISRQLGW